MSGKVKKKRRRDEHVVAAASAVCEAAARVFAPGDRGREGLIARLAELRDTVQAWLDVRGTWRCPRCEEIRPADVFQGSGICPRCKSRAKLQKKLLTSGNASTTIAPVERVWIPKPQETER